MSIDPSQYNLRKFDYNNDGVLNHGDMEAFIHNMSQGRSGSAGDLLKFQKAGGEVTAQDWLDFAAEGGKADGSDISRFVEQGGKMTKEELAALQKAGVEFTEKELTKIETKLGFEHISKFPPGTTVEEVMEMADAGVKINPADLITLKKADGSQAFIDIKDLIKLAEKGCKVTGADLLAFQKTGGNFNGDHMVDYVNAGGSLSSKDLTALAVGGVQIYKDDLTYIIDTLGLKINTEQYLAINPVKTANDTEHVDDYSPGFTM